jgi:hypothetical protein
MGFHGRAAAHNSKITMRNAKCWLDWYKACRHWTLEQLKRVLWSDDSMTSLILVAEWKQVPPAMFQHLVESLPRRVEAVLAAKGGPTPY